MKSSEPAEKLLSLLEALSEGSPARPTLRELARATEIPDATLLRMLRTLEARGYVTRDAEKRFHAAFRFRRLAKGFDWAGALGRLAEESGRTAERIEILPKELVWKEQIPGPEGEVTLRARIGFRRTLKELDCLGLLALAARGAAAVQADLGRAGFHGNAGPGKRIPWPEVAKSLRGVDLESVAFDEAPNVHSIRRHALLLQAGGGARPILVAVAEPVLGRGRNDSERIHGALLAFRARWIAAGRPLPE